MKQEGRQTAGRANALPHRPKPWKLAADFGACQTTIGTLGNVPRSWEEVAYGPVARLRTNVTEVIHSIGILEFVLKVQGHVEGGTATGENVQ